MLLGHFKGLLNSLSDCDRRNNDDKLGETVSLVELEHRLDINVGLTRTGLHFHVEINRTEVMGKGVRFFDICDRLNIFDVIKEH